MMQKMQLSPTVLLQPQVWLAASTGAIAALHLSMSTHHSSDGSNIGIHLLGWLAVGLLLWRRRQHLNCTSDLLSSSLGVLLLALVLLKSQFLTGELTFINLSPLLSCLGLALLASGLRGLPQYWQELVVVICVCGPEGFIARFIGLGPITAKVASYLMWYGGISVVNQGVYIYLPTGSVEVNPGCDGTVAITHLLGLSIIFMMLFFIQGRQRIVIPTVAMLLAFFVNIIRVILMTLLVASDRPTAFEYWHTGDGSNIFSLISVLLFGCYCYWILSKIPPAHPEI